MTKTKILTIAELALISVMILLWIIIFSTVENIKFNIVWSIGGVFSIFMIGILPLALLVIGILQIVFKQKEKERGIHLACGILCIICIIPGFIILLSIPIIVCSIIGICLKRGE